MSSRVGTRFAGRLAVGLMLAAGPAVAIEPSSPPTELVKSLDGSLLDVMQNARTLGFKGRFAKLEPIVRRTFNVPLMTQVAVGSGWSELTADQQQQLTEAFTRFITATYAERFDGWSGEKFVETGEKPLGSGTLVETQILRTDDEPVALNYVTRQSGGNWQVVDVFLTGTISELATRRSEFSAVFRRAGFDGLLQSLHDKVAEIERQAQVG